jgi:hypothetical protein
MHLIKYMPLPRRWQVTVIIDSFIYKFTWQQHGTAVQIN